MKLKSILALAIITIFSVNANAQTANTNRPVSTIKNDRQRIKQGVKSGELTPAEASKLKAQTAELAKERKDYNVDGISPAERKDLRKDKKQLSRKIYRKKHN